MNDRHVCHGCSLDSDVSFDTEMVEILLANVEPRPSSTQSPRQKAEASYKHASPIMPGNTEDKDDIENKAAMLQLSPSLRSLATRRANKTRCEYPRMERIGLLQGTRRLKETETKLQPARARNKSTHNSGRPPTRSKTKLATNSASSCIPRFANIWRSRKSYCQIRLARGMRLRRGK
jgi:hypothetical protein